MSTALASKKILVLLEPGRAGMTAIDAAHRLTQDGDSTVTVVSIVPQAASGARCGNSALEYNSMVKDAVGRELDQARARLTEIADRASFELLIDGDDPPLEAWSEAAGFDLVLLPGRRRPLRAPAHPAASALRRTGVEVRIVDPRAG